MFFFKTPESMQHHTFCQFHAPMWKLDVFFMHFKECRWFCVDPIPITIALKQSPTSSKSRPCRCFLLDAFENGSLQSTCIIKILRTTLPCLERVHARVNILWVVFEWKFMNKPLNGQMSLFTHAPDHPPRTTIYSTVCQFQWMAISWKMFDGIPYRFSWQNPPRPPRTLPNIPWNASESNSPRKPTVIPALASMHSVLAHVFHIFSQPLSFRMKTCQIRRCWKIFVAKTFFATTWRGGFESHSGEIGHSFSLRKIVDENGSCEKSQPLAHNLIANQSSLSGKNTSINPSSHQQWRRRRPKRNPL